MIMKRMMMTYLSDDGSSSRGLEAVVPDVLAGGNNS
jgi:hypothetical protein